MQSGHNCAGRYVENISDLGIRQIQVVTQYDYLALLVRNSSQRTLYFAVSIVYFRGLFRCGVPINQRIYRSVARPPAPQQIKSTVSHQSHEPRLQRTLGVVVGKWFA